MKVVIGSDKKGFELKEKVKKYLLFKTIKKEKAKEACQRLPLYVFCITFYQSDPQSS